MILSLLLSNSTAYAVEIGVGGYAGHWALPLESALPPDYTFGGRARLRWSDAMGVEFGLGSGPGGLDPRLELLKFFPNESMLTPFAALGGGAVVGTASPMWLASGGGGVDAELFPWLDFRADLRLRVLGETKPTASILFDTGLQIHTARVHDADGDGIPDRSDACKDVPEDKDAFEDADGCPDPDNDKDGVPDATDACVGDPEDADGFEDGDGCPDLDNDKDGVPDTADKCPDVAEDADNFEDSDGCIDPDNDHDGLVDGKDSCPNVAETVNGFQDSDGCADEIPAEVAKFSGVIAGVNFETNKAVLLPSSKKVLDEAAAVLLKFPEIRLEVSGHTDDVGNDGKNLALSQGRAETVVAYLVGKGVAADRLTAKGYGETTPKVPNDSAANRALNRRVEFKRL